MNEQDYCEALIQLLSDVTYHDKLIDDLLCLLSKSGQETRFLSVLVTALQILRTHGRNSIYVKRSQFEKLSYEESLYSMHVNTAQTNCRILYTFSFGKPVLLYGFHERKGHKKTDYSQAVKFARARMEEWRTKYE